MGILHKNKTIVGIFDDDQEAERAINLLSQQGFGVKDNGDHIEVIDQHRFAASGTIVDEVLAVPPPLGANNPPGMGVNRDSRYNPTEMEQAIKYDLLDRGLEEDEAGYFARHVIRGGVLLVLETNEERAAQASAVIEQLSNPTV
jgi:hypothetical protein